MPDTVIDAQEVVDAFGEYYIDEGQNMENLHMLPFEPFGTQEAGTIVETDQTVLRESNVTVQSLLQQYQDEFTPKGGVAFLPVFIPLFQMKVDQKFNPTKLQSTWVGFLTSNKLDRTEWPFIRWFIEKYIYGQVDEDLELKAIYSGVFEEPEPGVAGVPEKVMNGLEFIMDELETAGDIEPIVTGATPVSASDFVTQIENFVKAVPEKLRYNYVQELNMSRTLRDKFKQGMRDKYNVNYQQTDQLLRLMDYENITVVGRASMATKSRYWMTPKFNLLFPTKGFTNKKAVEIEKVDRFVKIWSDWWMGAGFVQGQLVFKNDQD